MHLQVDAKPHILHDDLGMKLIAPPENWRERPDMHLQGTAGYRAGVVGRARFIEDLVEEQNARGVAQYVILGAGLDTFAQRNPEIASRLEIFEVDQPSAQAWKRERLIELGMGIPRFLHLVPVDFEAGDSWLEKITANSFQPTRPAVVVSTGVSIYLTREANLATLQQIAKLAPGSTLAMTFLLPLDMIDAAERPQHQMLHERARASGTPFISFFRPEEMISLAREAGFRDARHFSTDDMVRRYFSNRSDGFKPATGESILIATT